MNNGTPSPNSDYTNLPIKRTEWQQNIANAAIESVASKMAKAQPALTINQELMLKIGHLNNLVRADVEPVLKLMPIMNRDIAMVRMQKAYLEHLATWSKDDMHALCALVLAAQQTENLPE